MNYGNCLIISNDNETASKLLSIKNQNANPIMKSKVLLQLNKINPKDFNFNTIKYSFNQHNTNKIDFNSNVNSTQNLYPDSIKNSKKYLVSIIM